MSSQHDKEHWLVKIAVNLQNGRNVTLAVKQLRGLMATSPNAELIIVRKLIQQDVTTGWRVRRALLLPGLFHAKHADRWAPFIQDPCTPVLTRRRLKFMLDVVSSWLKDTNDATQQLAIAASLAAAEETHVSWVWIELAQRLYNSTRTVAVFPRELNTAAVHSIMDAIDAHVKLVPTEPEVAEATASVYHNLRDAVVLVPRTDAATQPCLYNITADTAAQLAADADVTFAHRETTQSKRGQETADADTMSHVRDVDEIELPDGNGGGAGAGRASKPDKKSKHKSTKHTKTMAHVRHQPSVDDLPDV